MQVVEDTLADARFRGNPLVTSPRTALRFYAGAPLMSSDGSGACGEGELLLERSFCCGCWLPDQICNVNTLPVLCSVLPFLAPDLQACC